MGNLENWYKKSFDQDGPNTTVIMVGVSRSPRDKTTQVHGTCSLSHVSSVSPQEYDKYHAASALVTTPCSVVARTIRCHPSARQLGTAPVGQDALTIIAVLLRCLSTLYETSEGGSKTEECRIQASARRGIPGQLRVLA